MSTEYPLDPFTEFATRQNDPAEYEIDIPVVGWGSLRPERRAEPAPLHGAYAGVGEDNPYGDQTCAPAVARSMGAERDAAVTPPDQLWSPPLYGRE